MQLFLKTLTGRTISIDVPPDATILDVKNKVNSELGVPEEQFFMTFAGKVLLEEHLTPQLLELGFMRSDTLVKTKMDEISFARRLLICNFCCKVDCKEKYTLTHYKIQRESAIHIIIRLRGC